MSTLICADIKAQQNEKKSTNYHVLAVPLFVWTSKREGEACYYKEGFHRVPP